MRRVRTDLARALLLLGWEKAELSVLFVGSRKMKTLNTLYRGIPKETDVLSFSMTGEQTFPPGTSQPLVLGDIVISVPRAIRQAQQYGASFQEELRRLLIHGLLHLLGHDHEKSRYRKLKMEKKEKEMMHAISRLG